MGSRRLCLLTALLVGAGCTGPVNLDLSGRITDSTDGAALAGQPVLLLYQPGAYQLEAVGTESGPDGRFTLWLARISCDGAPTLAVGRSPWLVQEKPILCTSEPQSIDFELTR